jgi:hydrogenase nickel incorporation protein HypA/HybF
MHELAIAQQLVSIAEEAAREAGASRVETVYLRLGDLAGVVREALDFAYEIASARTRLEGSRLVIERVPVRVHCEACDLEGPPLAPERLRCARCEKPTPRIVAGRELLIRAIECDTESAPRPEAPSSSEGSAPTRATRPSGEA